MAGRSGVSGMYFRSMGIPVIAGRAFTEADGAGARAAAIVSRSMARRLRPNASPLGQRIALAAPVVPSVAGKPTPTDWLTIVGVVGDVVQVKLTDPPPAAIYQPLGQVSGILFQSYPYFMSHVRFTVRTTADPLTAGRAMRNVIHGLDRDVPVEAVGPLGDVVSDQRQEPLFQTRLLIAFSLLALVLAVVGTYGVLA
ncbi:MAG: ABC transporter permease, partial [Gemmatimonadota bacterium]